MKKIVVFLLLALFHLNTFAQLGYWCESKFVALTPDESCNYKYVQGMDIESQKILNDRFTSLAKMKNQSIRSMGEARFYVDKDYSLPEANYFESTIYKSPNGGKIVIFPRIAVSLADGFQIDGVLEHLGGKVRIESSEKGRYILACQMRTSEEVLEAVKIISKLDGIKYFVNPSFSSPA